MKLNEVKINNEVVKALPVKKYNKEEILGYSLFFLLYANIFICAKKNSGKTCTIWKIIKSCANKKSKIFVFCSTIFKDESWNIIFEKLDKKGIEYEKFTNTDDFDAITKVLETEDDENEENPINQKYIPFDSYTKYIVKKREPKIKAPKYFFIFDDMSEDLKNPEIAAFVKRNRHFKSKVIISSQYPNDIKPETRKQMDYWLLFKGHSEAKLEEMFKLMDLDINFEEFYALYKKAVQGDYHFLYIDVKGFYRRDFNTLLKIEKEN